MEGVIFFLKGHMLTKRETEKWDLCVCVYVCVVAEQAIGLCWSLLVSGGLQL